MLKKKTYFDRLTESGEFVFRRLTISGIRNEAVLDANDPTMADEEISLFHAAIRSGDDYLDELHAFISSAVEQRRAAPIVRFADGEYAFYNQSLRCNGLYRQAESGRSIRKSLPIHVRALQRLSESGKMAALVFPGNLKKNRAWHPFGRKESTATGFLEFLFLNGIELKRDNYIPFYAVYAYLTSPVFSALMHGKRLCLISSEYDQTACHNWFARRSCRPDICFIKIPDSYVATQWPCWERDILTQIPENTDLCLIGAGAGALLVAVGVSEALSIPTVDAGHVLNMMNGRLDKSNGARLYTNHYRDGQFVSAS